jgi:hypothetical protein
VFLLDFFRAQRERFTITASSQSPYIYAQAIYGFSPVTNTGEDIDKAPNMLPEEYQKSLEQLVRVLKGGKATKTDAEVYNITSGAYPPKQYEDAWRVAEMERWPTFMATHVDRPIWLDALRAGEWYWYAALLHKHCQDLVAMGSDVPYERLIAQVQAELVRQPRHPQDHRDDPFVMTRQGKMRMKQCLF